MTHADAPVQELAKALLARQHKLFVVEASAGGALQAHLSAQPGASAWLLGGLNCYHDSIKTGPLGLDAHILAQHGSVSPQAVTAMAQCGLRISGADWVLVESGVYGPAGGSPEKPVGLVISGIGQAQGIQLQRHQLSGSRQTLREQVTALAVKQLLAALQA